MPELLWKVQPVDVTRPTLAAGLRMQVRATCLPSWKAVLARPVALAAAVLRAVKV